VWISTSDGDLLRADQVRQITVVGGLRVVTTSGSRFLVAEIKGRKAATATARALAAALAAADTRSGAAQIDVVREGSDWKVRVTAIPDAGGSPDEPDA
jgi:hypothetical protein